MTIKKFTQEINRVKKQGQEQYAHWNNELFMEICEGAAQICWNKIQHQHNKEKVFAAYMELIREGIGNAYITQSIEEWQYDYLIPKNSYQIDITWNSFLEYCLLKEIPLNLSQIPAEQQLELLTKIWNLGENILEEKPWIGLYILSRAEELPTLSKIEDFLIEIMTPLLRPSEKSNWQSPYKVSILDGRKIHDNFIPGDMHQVAPSVVCVHDRRLSNVYGGIFLNNEPNTLLFHNQCLGNTQHEESEINLSFEDSNVTIESNQVELTRLGEHYSYLLCNSGQLLVTAVDSQRIWQVVAN